MQFRFSRVLEASDGQNQIAIQSNIDFILFSPSLTQSTTNETKMATLVRSMCKLSYNVSRLSHFRRLPFKAKIAQPTCSIFTSNKKKDAATLPVSDKEGKEVERLDNLLEKDEVCC